MAILDAVSKYPRGASIAEVHRELKSVTRRTLARRLTDLVKARRLLRRGKARATRYFLSSESSSQIVQPPGMHSEVSFRTPGFEASIPESTEGRAIRNYLRKPIGERRPVGYRREFLDEYRPNETAYLPESVRKHLLHIGRGPIGSESPAGTYARQILNRLLIDLSWASARLEGNTYSRLDTERLILFGQSAQGKDATETQMILNHKAAIEFLADQAQELSFNRYTFLNLHSLLAENLLLNPDAAGRLRQIPVEVSSTVFHPLAIPQVIEECFQQILDTAAAIQNPFEQSFFIMVHVPYLQPFEDVNKRVSRLGANISLILRNLCPLSFVDVPESAYVDGILGVYELNRVDLLRDAFIWAYERSCQRYLAVRQSTAEPDPFRLRYRSALVEAVGLVVRDPDESADAVLSEYAAREIEASDRGPFVELALKEIERLHEGTIARYRIRPSEYHAWKEFKPSD